MNSVSKIGAQFVEKTFRFELEVPPDGRMKMAVSVWQIVLGCSLSLSVGVLLTFFLSGPYSNSHEGCPCVTCGAGY